MKRLALVTGLVLFALVATPVAKPAQPNGPPRPGKHDAALEDHARQGRKGRERVIIRVVPGWRGALRAYLQSQGAHRIHREHAGIDAITAEVPADALAALESLPFVQSVSLDANLRAHQVTVTAAPSYRLRPILGLESSSPKGDGVGIAIIDSGIYPSPDFGTRITAFYDFTQGGIATAPYDDYGHGTHVAGLAAGSGALSNGQYAGVAPNARLIGLKVLNSSGAGSTSNVIAAIQFATANKGALGIDVINLSLGHPIFETAGTDPLVQAVQQAVAAGIVVVASAGNVGVNPGTGLPGYGGILSPGNAPAAITIGSLNVSGLRRRDFKINNFSSRGPTWIDRFLKPDLIAPGYRLVAPAAPGSLLAVTYPQFLGGGPTGTDYLTLSGTSMAAGVASGVAALAIQVNRTAFAWEGRPALKPNAVKAILEFTAVDLKDPATGVKYNPLIQGNGALNGHGVVELAKSIDTGAPRGQTWLARAVSPFSTLDEVITWTQSLLWSNDVLWGDTIYVNRDAWATDVLWGDAITWGSDILWGDAIIAGTDVLWGDNIIAANSIDAVAESIDLLNDD